MNRFNKYLATAVVVLLGGLTVGDVLGQERYWPPPERRDYRYERGRRDEDVRLIVNWYRKYLHQDPDPAGLQGNLYSLRNGAKPQDLLAGLLASGVYYQQQGGRDDSWILGLFHDLLGREPSRREMNSWLDYLGQTLSRNRFADKAEEVARHLTALRLMQDFGIRY